MTAVAILCSTDYYKIGHCKYIYVLGTVFQEILPALWCVFLLQFLKHVDVFKGKTQRERECIYFEFR